MVVSVSSHSSLARLGQVLREARRNASLTLDDVAKKAKVNVSWLRRVECGVLQDPSPEQLIKVVELLDLRAPDMLQMAGCRRLAELLVQAPSKAKSLNSLCFAGHNVSKNELTELIRFLGVLRRRR